MTTEAVGPVLRYLRSSDQDAAHPRHHRVIVVGAGPVGLSVAIDLARSGIKTVLLDDDDTLSTGSRAICFAKRTLEIWDRLGCGDRMVDKGVSWNVGKVFFRDAQVYAFDLRAEAGHRRPPFVNLQQSYVEAYLLDAAQRLANLEIRWKNEVVGLSHAGIGNGAGTASAVEITIATPDGAYRLTADYLIACDGSRSPIRGLMGLESKGQIFRDRFLIADVRMEATFPTERWFWFDPPFHPNQSVLLHRQPDNVWRIDFQLGWDADPVAERRPENVIPRVKALLGDDVAFELVWCSVYTFACQRMHAFRHGRVFFAGDSAHGVSPFGARGANSGVQDAENLSWKLKLVIEGKAPGRLLDTYASEREQAADENILNSTRSTDFITPKSAVSQTFRNAVLALSKRCSFARRLVNTGRLSVPATYHASPLNTPAEDGEAFAGAMIPGAPAADAPIRVAGKPGWFLDHVGDRFTCLVFADDDGAAAAMSDALDASATHGIAPSVVIVVPADTAPAPRHPGTLEDCEGLLAQRFDARAGTTYLLRPDQHICARWRHFRPDAVAIAVARATCNA